VKKKGLGERFQPGPRTRKGSSKTTHLKTAAMLILFALLVLGMLAISWLVYEPISGIVGSAFIAKIMAFVVAFKLISAVAGWIMGPSVVRIPL
jgi:hypothetical protein